MKSKSHSFQIFTNFLIEDQQIAESDMQEHCLPAESPNLEFPWWKLPCIDLMISKLLMMVEEIRPPLRRPHTVYS